MENEKLHNQSEGDHRIMTRQDIQDFARVTKYIAYQMLRDRRLHKMKVGREYRVYRKDLESYLELLKVEG